MRDAVAVVLSVLPERDPISFRDLVTDAASQLDVIVRFLAVLELYKQGVLDLEQFDTFGELRIRRLREGESALDAASIAEWDEPPETEEPQPVASEPE